MSVFCYFCVQALALVANDMWTPTHVQITGEFLIIILLLH